MVDISYLELKKMVDFFYNMSYDDNIPKETEQETELCISLLQLYAQMFALEDRYDIPGLREVAVKKYSSRCTVTWIPLEFLESISDVYRSTSASL
jgi:speckle-type POZ protein